MNPNGIVQMYDGPTTARSFLVVDMGFSRDNADIALSMLETGGLSTVEENALKLLEAVINYPNWRDSINFTHRNNLRKLNYRISTELEGNPNNGRGRSVLTPSRSRYAA